MAEKKAVQVSPDSSDDEKDDHSKIMPEAAEINPMLHLLFDFFLDPRATSIGYAYGLFLSILVCIHLLVVGLQTCDGPNQYPHGSSGRAKYPFLLDADQYWIATCVVTVPLVIDAFFRAFLLVAIFTAENPILRNKLLKSSFNVGLLVLDFLSLIPFCVEAGYLKPNHIEISSGANVLYEVIDILIVNRIFRVTKDMPAIWAIRIALARSAQHLVIPFFVFLIFNITAAVFFFFGEPCYDVETCAWHDLFEAMFFSVVAMVTVGYGTQTPKFALCRLVACLVMVFGAVFMSMPLAIIGNEYSLAWQEVTKELQLTKKSGGGSEGGTSEKGGSSTKEIENKGLFMFNRQQSTMIAPQATLSSISAVRGSLLKTQAASRAAMFALSASLSTRMSVVGHRQTSVTNLAALEQSGHGRIENHGNGSSRALDKIDEGAGGEGNKDGHSSQDHKQELSENDDSKEADKRNGKGKDKDKDNNSNSSDSDSDGGETRKVAPVATPSSPSQNQNANASAAQQFAAATANKRGAIAMQVQKAPAAGPNSSQHNKMLETHQRIMATSTIIETHKRIIAILEELQVDKLGSRLTPILLIKLCEVRSLMHSLVTATVFPIDYLTKAVQQQQQLQHAAAVAHGLAAGSSNWRAAAGIGSISASVVNVFFSFGGSRSLAPNTGHHHAAIAAGVGAGAAVHPLNGGKIKPARLSSLTPGQTATQAVEETEVPDNTFTTSLYRFIFGKSESENETDFQVMMKKVAHDPGSLRNRMWMLLELHHSSREARIVHFMVLFLIVLSILVLFTETLATWATFGEQTTYCESVVKAYCMDKHNPMLDPGCFVQNYYNSSYLEYVHNVENGVTLTNDLTPQRLEYYCDGPSCYGVGSNFGGANASMTCTAQGSTDDDSGADDDGTGYSVEVDKRTWVRPFQLRGQLLAHYGAPNLFTSRPAMHRQSAICNRMECNPPTHRLIDGNQIWIKLEILINVIFSIELCMRVAVADSVVRYFKDVMNTFDILAILPFYIDVYVGAYDFSILPSSPQYYLLVISRSFKVFRMFKAVRHFDATKVLIETAQKTYEQVLGIIGLLTFLVVVFAIMLYEVEKGHACFQGDEHCPDVLETGIRDGQRFLINKQGDVSQMPDVFYGLWFCFVTLTTTGFGDIVPVTNTGQVMTVFLMLAGSCYLSIPLAVAASTFYEVHRRYMKRMEAPVGAGALALANDMAMKKKKDLEWKRRLVLVKGSFQKYRDLLEQLITDLQSPVTPETHPGADGCTESTLVKKLKEVCVPMKKTMAACQEDIVQLVLTIAAGQVDEH